MPRATWNGQLIAEAPPDRCVRLEGNWYFPADAVHTEFLRGSDSHTLCAWKGTASYYDVVVDGSVNRDAAWYYPRPSEAAKNIAGRIAFWRGVQVEE